MGHYAFLVPAYTGHLNPMLVLARALERRGHRISVLSPPIAESKVRQAGLRFIPFAEREFFPGEWSRLTGRAGELTGFAATRAATEVIALLARAAQRELSEIAARERFDGLVMDQICVGTEGVCAVLGLPLAVACSALPMHIEWRVPPPLFPWPYRPALPFRFANVIGQFAVNMTGLAVAREIVPYRFRHRLQPMGYHYINELRPALVQVAQQPAAFDFPRRSLPDNFHYTAPWIEEGEGGDRNFPWGRLDGRPLIYASLGTLQNRLQFAFQLIVDACAGQDAQLVLALGREGASLPGEVPPGTIVVDYAPQVTLLRRATLVITHGGLNTVLESLRAGVPMIALPITNDQPGVAARLRHFGLGDFIPIREATAPALAGMIRHILRTPAYADRARQFAAGLQRLDGPAAAAELIEMAFTTRQRVRRNAVTSPPAMAVA